MYRWIGPYWIFQTIRAEDGLSHQIQVTNIVVVNPFEEDATVRMVFWERHTGGEFEASPLFGGTWTMSPKWQFGYRPDIRYYRGSRSGWFEIISNRDIVPHASIAYVMRRATSAGLVDPTSENTIPLQKRPYEFDLINIPPPYPPPPGETPTIPLGGTPTVPGMGGSIGPGGGPPDGSFSIPGRIDEINWELSDMVLEGRLPTLEEPPEDSKE